MTSMPIELENEISQLKAKLQRQELIHEELTHDLLAMKKVCSELVMRLQDLSQTKLHEELQHKWQAELELSCQNSLIGEMTQALVHDLTQPITAIAAYSRTCLNLMEGHSEDVKLPDKIASSIQKIATQTQLAGELIHKLKELMRAGYLSVEETNINLLIKETLSILHTDKKT